MSLNDRIFNFADALLVETAEVVKESIVEDLADFTGFDHKFGVNYPLALKSSLDVFYALKPDMVIVNEQAELTLMVHEAMADCNKAFKTILYFARKAFGSNLAIMKQFGMKEIEKVRNNQPAFTLFMESLCETTAKYKDALIAEGCNEAIIDEIPVLTSKLKNTNISQEKYKKERGLVTQTRVRSLNEIYKMIKPVHEIAQIIYSDNPAKLDKYSLPKPKSSNNTVEDLILS